MTGVAAGEPPIQFHAHRVRANEMGARQDFEEMIGLLVRAVHGDGALIHAAPGDWGIDAMIGDLNGDIRVWQAKYYIDRVGSGQQGEIDDAFRSAVRSATKQGHRVVEWTLCVPISLSPKARKWWDGWRVKTANEHGIAIDLWDETRLRELLMRPEAADIRRSYYEPRHVQIAAPARVHRIVPAPGEDEWQGGRERRIGRHTYLLHDGVVERLAPNRSWVMRELTADCLSGVPLRVRIRVVEATRDDARYRLGELVAQATILRRAASGRTPVPVVRDLVELQAATMLVTAAPKGRSWATAIGTMGGANSPYAAMLILGGAADIAGTLWAIHKLGASHRMLNADNIVFIQSSGRAALLDGGLVGFGPLRGEDREPGWAADARQMASLVYESLTGSAPAPFSPPLAAIVPAGVGDVLDPLIERCLGGRDVAEVPSAQELARIFRSAARTLSGGGL